MPRNPDNYGPSLHTRLAVLVLDNNDNPTRPHMTLVQPEHVEVGHPDLVLRSVAGRDMVHLRLPYGLPYHLAAPAANEGQP